MSELRAVPVVASVIRIGIKEVEQRFGAERSTIYRAYKRGEFPEPEYWFGRRVWRLDVIERWEAQQLASRTSPIAAPESASSAI